MSIALLILINTESVDILTINALDAGLGALLLASTCILLLGSFAGLYGSYKSITELIIFLVVLIFIHLIIFLVVDLIAIADHNVLKEWIVIVIFMILQLYSMLILCSYYERLKNISSVLMLNRQPLYNTV